MLVNNLNNQENIEKAIIETIAFFDLFDFPLTALELHNYLDKRISLAALLIILERKHKVACQNGFFFLPGREEIVDRRQKKYNYSLRKIKIARKFSRVFAMLPFVQAIFLSNSIGSFNLRDGSDIDFFIISQPRRLWLTRLYCAGLAALLNSRPNAKNKRDKICLSFYISSNSLDLNDLQLKPFDPYFFYWLRNLFLLYNKDKTYESFLSANNLLGAQLELINQAGGNSSSNKRVFKQKENFLLNFFEQVAKKFQLLIMAPDLKKAANSSVGVIINDKVLKLYLHDNRQEYLEKYGNKLNQIFTQGS